MKGLTDDIMAAMWAPGLGPETIYRDCSIYGWVSRDSLETRVFGWDLDIVLAERFGCFVSGLAVYSAFVGGRSGGWILV